jgi:hypothetical protein
MFRSQHALSDAAGASGRAGRAFERLGLEGQVWPSDMKRAQPVSRRYLPRCRGGWQPVERAGRVVGGRTAGVARLPEPAIVEGDDATVVEAVEMPQGRCTPVKVAEGGGDMNRTRRQRRATKVFEDDIARIDAMGVQRAARAERAGRHSLVRQQRHQQPGDDLCCPAAESEVVEAEHEFPAGCRRWYAPKGKADALAGSR